MRATTLLVLVAGACGGDGSGSVDRPTTWTSGDRLRARLMQPADGAAHWDGWHDRELDRDCAFADAADGTRRCLPLPAAYGDRFLDAACTRRVMAASPSCDPPEFAWVPDGCDVFAVHEAGAEVDLPADLFALDGADCVAAGTTDPRLRYLDVGDPVDLAGFVAGERVEGPWSTGAIQELVGADGSRRIVGLHDRATGAPLYATFALPNNPNAQVRRWLPSWDSAGEPGSYFADAGCTEPLACQIRHACGATPEPLAFVFGEGEACSFEPAFLEPGEVIAPVASVDDGAACGAIPAEEQAVLGDCVAVGPPVAGDRFLGVEPRQRGPGRIRALEAGAAGVAIHPEWYYFHDSLRDEPCFPLTAADGVTRCLPSFFIPYANHFLDAGCSMPIGYRHDPYTDACFPDAPPPPDVVGFDDDDDTGCARHFSDRTRHILRLTAPVDGTGTFVADGGCEPYDPTLHPGVIFGLEEVDPTEFVPVDVVVE